MRIVRPLLIGGGVIVGSAFALALLYVALIIVGLLAGLIVIKAPDSGC